MAAPKGNKNAARAKEWREALTYALKSYEGDGIERGKALKEIGKKLVGMALDGDIQAIKEVGDRIDGKAVQQVDMQVTENVNVDELSDAVLANIATRGSARATQTADSAKKLN